MPRRLSQWHWRQGPGSPVPLAARRGRWSPGRGGTGGRAPPRPLSGSSRAELQVAGSHTVTLSRVVTRRTLRQITSETDRSRGRGCCRGGHRAVTVVGRQPRGNSVESSVQQRAAPAGGPGPLRQVGGPSAARPLPGVTTVTGDRHHDRGAVTPVAGPRDCDSAGGPSQVGSGGETH